MVLIWRLSSHNLNVYISYTPNTPTEANESKFRFFCMKCYETSITNPRRIAGPHSAMHGDLSATLCGFDRRGQVGVRGHNTFLWFRLVLRVGSHFTRNHVMSQNLKLQFFSTCADWCWWDANHFYGQHSVSKVNDDSTKFRRFSLLYKWKLANFSVLWWYEARIYLKCSIH